MSERPLEGASLQYHVGRFALRNYTSCVGLIFALALINCFWRLSSNVVSDLDEARYGVAASEMLHRHALIGATYGGKPEYWNLKPPLGYWMQELAFYALGPNVFAMRLPAALCALGVIGLTMSVCRRWFGRGPALLAGLILTTCFGFFSYHGARSGDLDSALTLILLIAVIQIPKLVHCAGCRLVWAAMLALGFLLKSFAILPFVAVTLAYLAWSGDWRRIHGRDWAPAMALLTSIIVAWGLARTWHDGSAYFVERMIREDLWARTTRVIDSETTHPWSYLAVLLDRFAPWPLMVVAAALLCSRCPPRRTHLRLLLLLCWTLVPLTALSLARTHHHWYLDPTYPGWSMLAGLAGMQLLAASARHGRAMPGLLLCLSLLFCETRVLLRIGHTDRRPANQAFLVSLRDHALVPSNALIQAAFSLSHSERFILQVVDGYRVTEPDSPSWPPSIEESARTLEEAHGSAAGPRVLLVRRGQTGVLPGAPFDRQRSRVITVGADYVLLKSDSPW